MRIIGNRVPRKMFGPKRDKVIKDWRKLHNEDPHDLYSSTVGWMIKKRIRWLGHVAQMWERRGAYRVLVGKPVGKRQLRRQRHR
jgi:hypothetical protein